MNLPYSEELSLACWCASRGGSTPTASCSLPARLFAEGVESGLVLAVEIGALSLEPPQKAERRYAAPISEQVGRPTPADLL